MSDPTARAQQEARDRQATRDQNKAARLDLDRVARQHREALAATYERERETR